jgi:NADH:ubiquinone oxidoreductase subunit E
MKWMGSKEKKTVKAIYVCAGDACKENKSKKLRASLEDLLEERGLIEYVTVAKCGCLGCCKHGIAVELRPANMVLKHLKPKHAEQVLAQALAGKPK